MIDLSKLTPAIERLRKNLAAKSGERNFLMADITEVANQAERAAQAFDVMMRREWGVKRGEYAGKDGWFVVHNFEGGIAMLHGKVYGDPFTALVEADKWMKEREADQ